MENRLISAFPAVLGLRVKIILSQGLQLPVLTQQRAQFTLFPEPSALTTGPRGVYSWEPASMWPSANRIYMWLSKCHFYLKNTIMIGKFGLDFIDLEDILNFLPRKKISLIKTLSSGWKIRKLFPQSHLPPSTLWKESANRSLEGENSHHLVL